MEDVRIEHRYNASHFKLDNHYENVYQMLLITNGRIRYRVGNKTYETGRGGVIVLNTLEEHELEVLEYPYERYLIRVQPDFFQNEVKYPEVIAAFIKRPPNFSSHGVGADLELSVRYRSGNGTRVQQQEKILGTLCRSRFAPDIHNNLP